VIDLILPLVPGTEPDLVEALIVRTSDQFGSDAALDTAQHLVRRIRVDALANSRLAWYRGVAAGLRTIGHTPGQVGLQLSELKDRPDRSESELDRSLYLHSGERLEPDEVLAQVRVMGDLRALIKNEDRERTQYFDWAASGARKRHRVLAGWGLAARGSVEPVTDRIEQTIPRVG